ncbi:hypothetical protein CBW46_014765 [Paenibacillus xerothermodurans]|uniref:Uncharacterized protein n=1 Tax=Paenibacillus xerothermodurans TaxID=1977292 RepID=A0A2W1N913_PAEXE|nr:hypothetical protein CBW46_014765 [Paenibacillus xerothermodurans]
MRHQAVNGATYHSQCKAASAAGRLFAFVRNIYPDLSDMRRMGEQFSTPEAVVLFSAHWVSGTQSFTATDAIYDTMYEFGGFPDVLFQVTYPTVGAPDVVCCHAPARLSTLPFARPPHPETAAGHSR